MTTMKSVMCSRMMTLFGIALGTTALSAGCDMPPDLEDPSGAPIVERSSAITVDLEDGELNVWPLNVRQDLTYCIHSSFDDAWPGFHELVATAMNEAAAEWEDAADVDFRHVEAEDGDGCTNLNNNVLFNVVYGDVTGGVAEAFRPHESRANRVITISEAAVIRHVFGGRQLGPLLEHELGHTIGFMHEHHWSSDEECDNPDIVASLLLTPIDTASVMWYPNNCESTHPGDYALTQNDRLGAACLYNRNTSMATCNKDRTGSDVMWWNQGTGQSGQSIPNPTLAQLLAGDFNGDGADDIFFYGRGPSRPDWVAWGGVENFSTSTSPFTVDGYYDPIVGDLNGDGRDDIFWYGPGTRPDRIWWGQANRTFTSQSSVVNGVYHPIAGDFDGNGCADILWHRPDGTDSLWYFQHDGSHSYHFAVIDGAYRPVVGDFDADGRDDIFWYQPGVDSSPLWWGDVVRGKFDKVTKIVTGDDYYPFTGDFNGDGRDDIFWYQPGAGADYIWDGKWNRSFDSRSKAVSGYYSPVTGDFDGDDDDDIYWSAPL